MARNRRSAKDAGTRFETSVAAFLAEKTALNTIMRMPKHGAKDKGDIFGVTVTRTPMTIECKAPGKGSTWTVAAWLKELAQEQVNMSTTIGMVVVSNYRRPIADSVCIIPEETWNAFCHAPQVTTMSLPATKWATIPREHATPVRINRRGTTVVVCSLETVSALIDHAPPQAYRVELSSAQREQLLGGKEVTITAGEITIILATASH